MKPATISVLRHPTVRDADFLRLSFTTWFSGTTLTKCGQTHQKLGHAYKDFIQSAAMGYMQPLKSYLEGEMKSIAVNLRLDPLCLISSSKHFRKNVEHWNWNVSISTRHDQSKRKARCSIVNFPPRWPTWVSFAIEMKSADQQSLWSARVPSQLRKREKKDSRSLHWNRISMPKFVMRKPNSIDNTTLRVWC